MTFQTSAPLVHTTLQQSARRWQAPHQLVRDGWMDTNPPYQRGSVWDTEQRMNLVRSALLGLPIPAVMINDRTTAAWKQNTGEDTMTTGVGMYAVIDGKQRVETICAWYDGDLAVPASWFSPEHVETTEDTEDGPYVRYTGLSTIGRRHFDNRAILPVVEAHAASVAEEADLYLLLNMAGTPQSEADLDNAAAHSSSM